MKTYVIVFLSMILISCNDKSGIINNQEYVIFKSTYIHEIYNHESYELNHNDIKKLETIIEKELKENLKFHSKNLLESNSINEHNKIEDLTTFIRQYSAHKNDESDIIVVIQFMCNQNNEYRTWKKDWKSIPIGNILDGGSCFFNIYVNFTKREVLDAYFNSVSILNTKIHNII